MNIKITDGDNIVRAELPDSEESDDTFFEQMLCKVATDIKSGG